MVDFTEQQHHAIYDRGKDILVSASAGSGKTAVLVERVIQRVLSGTPVSQLLIITFTKAAASEMKEKIKNELTKQIDKDPNNSFLRTQLVEIDTANISTIDSFCLDVIRRYYYVIDLDPSFSVLTDETQKALLEEKALKEIEDKYLSENDQDFLDFYDNFSGDREVDGAHELLLNLYNVAMTQPNYVDYLKNLALFYDVEDDILDSYLWKSQIKVLLLQKTKQIKKEVLDLIDQAQKYPENFTDRITKLTNFYSILQEFEKLIKTGDSYNDILQKFQTITIDRFKKISGNSESKDRPEVKSLDTQMKNFKSNTTDQLKDLFSQFFAADSEEQLEVLKQSKKIVQIISKIELEFIEKFGELKREQNLLDYSDMEQFANAILTSDTSNSNLAQNYYQNKFTEILVDEYQDVNYLQEAIINAIKQKGKNTLFMVGDVKQSIYGFRQAQPDLFIEKYQNFNQGDATERIILSDNFRSSKNVIDTVNNLFNPILTKDFGGIDYREEAQLVHGAAFDKNVSMGTATEFIFTYSKNKGKQFNSDDVNENLQDEGNQVKIIINRIKQLKKENFQVWDKDLKEMRPFKYSDIAILTRTHSGDLQIMQEFAKADIPLFIADAQNYFQTFELTMIMNYLRIIDNPRQDIPLVSVLRSPLFNFTEPDFAQIRINSRTTDFFDAVVSYAKKDNELGLRCKTFLNQLEKFRQFSTSHRISELIWSIYEENHLLEIVTGLPNGQQRRVNLQSLYERASSYESAGFKGLYQFINFIERMRKNHKDLAQPLLSDQAENAVKLMTIHGSKGLEFPIVFINDLGHGYQKKDLQGDYIISPKLGLGISIKKETYSIDSLLKSVIKQTKKREELEEEARVLYVALTRARQKLIMVSEVPEKDANVDYSPNIELPDLLSVNSSWGFIRHQLNIKNHVLQTISEMNSESEKQNKILYLYYDPNQDQTEEVNNLSQTDELSNDYIAEKVKKLYTFDYPFKDATTTTAYQAVSEIKNAFNDPLDTELENAHLIASTNRYLQPIDSTPTFLKKKQFTGAEIGTATHLILQYYDYQGEKNEENLEKEIQALISTQKLNPDIVPYLDKSAINWFVMNDFTNNFWNKPTNLHRESEFSSLVQAKMIFPNFSDPSAQILVHGTIDGFFEAEDGIILFDYKTDHVDKTHLNQSIEKIKQKYSGQLRLYENALNEMKDLKVKSKYLILLDAKKLVKLD